jgi:hypothetical protein
VPKALVVLREGAAASAADLSAYLRDRLPRFKIPAAWEFRTLATSHNNYDHGSLYVEPDGAWRVIAPTAPGPQDYNPGGEVVSWLSRDQGASWQKVKQLTTGSKHNHTYMRRPVNAHPDFYSLWADGNAREPSESSLYFTNRAGDHVWRLPTSMAEDFAAPEVAW